MAVILVINRYYNKFIINTHIHQIYIKVLLYSVHSSRCTYRKINKRNKWGHSLMEFILYLGKAYNKPLIKLIQKYRVLMASTLIKIRYCIMRVSFTWRTLRGVDIMCLNCVLQRKPWPLHYECHLFKKEGLQM